MRSLSSDGWSDPSWRGRTERGAKGCSGTCASYRMPSRRRSWQEGSNTDSGAPEALFRRSILGSIFCGTGDCLFSIYTSTSTMLPVKHFFSQRAKALFPGGTIGQILHHGCQAKAQSIISTETGEIVCNSVERGGSLIPKSPSSVLKRPLGTALSATPSCTKTRGERVLLGLGGGRGSGRGDCVGCVLSGFGVRVRGAGGPPVLRALVPERPRRVDWCNFRFFWKKKKVPTIPRNNNIKL